MKNRFTALKLNSELAILYQAVLIITSLILPRCFLYYYGSEVNGLVTSITQFLAFVNICDLGISAVVSSAYYKPLAENDVNKISKIFVYSRKFFRTVGMILFAYIVFLLAFYPTFINTDFEYWFTFTLIAAMGISQLGQYFIGISYQLLLNSDQRSYVQLIVNGSTLILNTVASIILMITGADIRTVKLITSLIYLLRPILMWLYVKKHYTIDFSVTSDSSVVEQKKNGIIQHISYMIYENTDVMVLTFFSTLENVSVYSIYTMVTGSIKRIINSATTGVQALLGNMIANEEGEELFRFYSFYNWGVHTVSTLMFTVTGLLIVPFVSIYTSDINDADYHAPVFAVLITIAYFFSTVRNCDYVLIRAAGHYKQTQNAALAEALLNLIISVVCVFKFGLIGVAIGTAVSTLFFVIYQLVYFSKRIIFLPLKYSAKQIMVDVLTSAVGIAAAINISVFENTVITWLMQAVIVTVLCGAVSVIIQFVFYKNNMLRFTHMLVKKKGQ